MGYLEKHFLGIIPARGGSKRLPSKNIRPLAGKPLLTWTIEAALQSRFLDAAMVS
ncbi:acylneuraminate cytidylyltransferase family protein, partial [Candidatus Parcubacteria bacterium]